MRAPRIRSLADGALVWLFVAAIAAPLLLLAAGAGGGSGQREKRALAAFPVPRPTLAAVKRYPRALGAWFEDRFGLRERLVRWHNRLKAPIGVSGVPSVVLGKDGWLFLDREADIMDQYRGLRRLTGVELALWAEALEARRAWLAARGIAYLVVVVPEKHTIYPEYVPDHLTRVPVATPLDELQAYLSSKGYEPVLDLRPVLARAKGGPLLYMKTDTHWNALGAFLAYREIVAALAERHRLPMSPDRLEAFEVTWRETDGGDLAEMLALEDLYRERRVVLVRRDAARARAVSTTFTGGRRIRVYETGDRRLPHAVVIHDSFALDLIPYLSEHFERIVYVWGRNLAVDVITAERPAVVIHELAERWLVVPPRDDLAPAGAGAGHGALRSP